MDNSKANILEQNIKMLEAGITLQDYIKKEEEIKIDGDTKIYNEYGFFVVYNKTKQLYLLDGGNNPSGFTMSITIHQFFVTNDGCGNPYMHKHYMEGDNLILVFWRYDKQKYASMQQLKEHIESYYDSMGETYYDFIVKMQDSSYTKKDRTQGYNSYYKGKSKESGQRKTIEEPVTQQPEKTKSMAAALLHLESKSKFLYNFLNAIVDLLIKPLPIFIWMLVDKGINLFAGANVIQSTFTFISNIIAAYIASIMVYVILLFVVQIIKLFVCTYKPLVIHFKAFDIIIKLSRKKILSGDDRELKELLYEHERIIEERKEKRENSKSRAYERKEQRELQELEFAQKEYERAKDSAQRNRDSAEYNFKKAREGGTLFSSAETKREEAKRDARRAEYDEQNARYYEERIKAKKRSLGIKDE